jgi:phenylalanyl-tRNA synthetase alpha chain
MEGVKIFTKEELGHASNEEERVALVVTDLKQGLEGMVKSMFGDVQVRWVDTYFPFTLPSFELEIFFNGAWLEVLGCGVVHKDILASVDRGEQLGWAFGLGLERLAMVLFSIPDIRLFWSMDDRFKSQFKDGKIVKFQSFSKYPPCLKDLSFWIPESFHPNDLNEIVRSITGDLVEKVELIDQFIHPKTMRTSNCFRIYYRSMERSLTNDEIDSLQERVRSEVVAKLNVEIR